MSHPLIIVGTKLSPSGITWVVGVGVEKLEEELRFILDLTGLFNFLEWYGVSVSEAEKKN